METARRLAAQLILTCTYAQAETTLREHGFEPPDFPYTVGMAFFVAMIGALLNKPVQEQLVILGEMSLRGGLQPVGSLTERLQLAMDNGARRVLLPLENKREFVDVPGDVLDKLQIIFYSDPVNAAFRAMGLD